MIKLFEVRVDIGFSREKIIEAISHHLGVDEADIRDFIVLKRAIDARNKHDICYKCNFAVDLDPKLIKKRVKTANYQPYEPKKREIRPIDVIVVGSGPSGLFAAKTLCEAGANVTILEQGEQIEKRVKTVQTFLDGGAFNENSNIQMGEGGAGTFSDGKLNTGIKSPFIDEVLHTFYECGADPDILFDSKPHIGTDKLREVIVSLREKMKSCGAKFLFETRFEDFRAQDGKIIVSLTRDGKMQEMACDKLILAIGYSARQTHRKLESRGMEYKQKPFSVGYRIEHLQEDISRAQYGSFAHVLPPADYKLATHLEDGIGVYTFCMCPGGEVVPAMEKFGQIVTNGMSNHQRDGKNANSAILASVSTSFFGSDRPLAGMEFQEKLEKEAFEKGGGKFIVQRVGDFLAGRKTTRLGKVKPTIRPAYVLGSVQDLLPEKLVCAIKKAIVKFGASLKGFDCPDAILTGIETRSSAPFMVPRRENNQTNIENVYSVGEGAGQAGGIVSSAVDGIKIAESIIDENN